MRDKYKKQINRFNINGFYKRFKYELSVILSIFKYIHFINLNNSRLIYKHYKFEQL